MDIPRKKDLGTFEIESGNVRVSDPCYNKDTWCNGLLNNVSVGRWKSYVYVVEDDIFNISERSSVLISHLESVNSDNLHWEKTDIHVGVDSGQAGIYDDKYFKDDKSVIKSSTMYNYSMPVLSDNYFNDLDKVMSHDFGISINKRLAESAKIKLKEGKISKDEYDKEMEIISESLKERTEYIKENLYMYNIIEIDWSDKGNNKPKKDGDRWYDVNCANTLGVYNQPGKYHKDDINERLGGVIPFGVVSQSGYGDGGYPCHVAKENGKIVGIKITFIDDFDEDDF